MKTREQWKRIVQGSCKGLSGEQIEKVIDYLIETPSAGAWHGASVITKTVCHCQKCKPGTKYL